MGRQMTNEEKALVEDNIALATYIANKWYVSCGIDMDEAVSICRYGMVKAAMAFNADRGCKFSTFASKVMNNEVLSELRRRRREVISVSMEEEIPGTKGVTIGDAISCVDDGFGYYETVECIKTCVEKLSQKEKHTIQTLLDNPNMTQNECASIIGVSQPMYSRRLAKIKRKLMEDIKDAYSGGCM